MPRAQLLNEFGKPIERNNVRVDLGATPRIARLSYDAARSGTDLDGHWAFADALDADSANNPGVRRNLRNRSRYEQGSNGYYDGIINTYCDMLVGVGPSLRMMTGNRDFNQLVEREFYAWAQRIQLRRKLWCMAHARMSDGEVFGLLVTNPRLPGVQLDLMPIEAEQCQSGIDGFDGRVDGIHKDEFDNVIAYDILPYHPGGNNAFQNFQPKTVPASTVVHWFKMKRPSGHRGIPPMTSTLNVGAMSRRSREATVAAQESAASVAALLKTNLVPSSNDGADEVASFSSVEFERRMMMVAPMGWDVTQMESKHPNAQYSDFHRLQISEQGRPISMPYNAAACDSSTYSFASGKLDTLCFRAALDVDRKDCDDTVLDKIFAAWFREWTLVVSRRDIPPNHQFDWPIHPVIDAVAEESAVNTKLCNGSTTHRKVATDRGEDYEDNLAVQAEDTFGEASEENVAKCRQINVLRVTPAHAIPYVAQLLGLEPVQAGSPQREESIPSGPSNEEDTVLES